MPIVLSIIDQILALYLWVVFIAVTLSWLLAFGVINVRNKIVASVVMAFIRLTEPVFAAIRKIVPSLGGLDLSPIIVFFSIDLIRVIINNVLSK